MFRISYLDAPAALFYLSGAAYGTAAGIVSAAIPEPRKYVPLVLKVRILRCSIQMSGIPPQQPPVTSSHWSALFDSHCSGGAVLVQSVWDSQKWGGYATAEVPALEPADSKHYKHSMLPIAVCGGPQSGKTTLLSWWSTGRRQDMHPLPSGGLPHTPAPSGHLLIMEIRQIFDSRSWDMMQAGSVQADSGCGPFHHGAVHRAACDQRTGMARRCRLHSFCTLVQACA